MVLHGCGPTLDASEALGAVLREQFLDAVLSLGVDVPGVLDPAREDLLVDSEGALVVEGRVAGEHLVDEDAESPPVDGLAVAL